MRGRTPSDPVPKFDKARRALCAAAPAWGISMLGGGMLAACATRAPPSVQGVYRTVPPIERGPDGGLPIGWEDFVQRPDRARTRYTVERRDGSFRLHAVADSASSSLACRVDIDPRITPWLRWQWRVDALHARASVADDLTEDCPARVVIAFDGDLGRLSLNDYIFSEQVEMFTGHKLPFATLTYVWDGHLPVESVLPYVRCSRIQYLVVENGEARLGRWLGYERNVLEDYRRVFGEPPSGHITHVGVLTDSDDLKNHVEAWYGDIGLFEEPLAEG